MKNLVCLVAIACAPLLARTESVSFQDYDETSGTFVRRERECTLVTSETTTFADGGWYAVKGDVTIASGQSITVNGAAHLILCDDASLTVTNVPDKSAAIDVSADDSVSNKLTIYGQKKGTGRLVAAGGSWGAGIGGGDEGRGGTVTINGGTVTATGGCSGAGIGGGYGSSGGTVTINGGTVTAIGEDVGAGIGGGYKGKGGVITISGGEVTATGGTKAAGIGGGAEGEGGTVTISGGWVTATGGTNAAGIGGGNTGKGGTVTISGGIVTATGQGGGKGIGGGSGIGGATVTITSGTIVAAGWNGLDGDPRIGGGNVKAWSNDKDDHGPIAGTPKDATGKTDVYCVTVEVGESDAEELKVEGLDGYGTRDIHPVGGRIYLYLPNGAFEFTVNGTRYVATVNGAATMAVPGEPEQLSDYTVLEYIESTAGGEQYINTGYVPTRNTRIVADLHTMTRSSNWSGFFGAGTHNNSDDAVLLRYFRAENTLNARFCSDIGDKDLKTADYAGMRIAVELKAGSLTINGNVYSIGTKDVSPGVAYPIYLFTINFGNNSDGVWPNQAMRLYSFKIYEGGTLMRDFVPCSRKSDGAVGLYDRVYDKFYGNAGKGSFVIPPPAEEYAELEAIESTAGGGQYIDTGYKPNQDTHVVMDVTVQSATEYWFAVCDKRFCEGAFGVCNDGKEGVYSGYGNQGNSTDKAVANGRHTIELDKNIVKVDGSNIRTFDVCTFQLNNNLYLFASNDAGQHKVVTGANQGNIRCHGCKIYEGSTLMRDFVPCMRKSDGAVGLYDRAGRTFYENKGTEPFVIPLAKEYNRPLPQAYAEIDYIESTAGGGQYINTGYRPNQNTRVSMDVDVRGGKEYWFGVWDENWNKGAFCLGNDGDDQGIYYAVGDDGGSFKKVSKTASGCVPNGRHTVEITPYSFLMDGEIWMTKERKADFQLGNNLYLFTQNRKGTALVEKWLAGIRCYGCKIYEGSALMRDFVPCRRKSDGAVGLYDLANGKFYESAGEGAFVGPPAAEYEALEYIESTAGGKQYIDTGYRPTVNTRIEADFDSMTRSQAWGVFFGVTGNDSSKDGILLRYYDNTDALNGWFCNLEYGEAQIGGLENTRVMAELKAGGMVLNGKSAAITTMAGDPCSRSIYLFCGNNGGLAWRHQAMRLYSFKIYEGNSLKRDFVPCRRKSDGAVGLYDLVGRTFYANKGTGSFGTPPARSKQLISISGMSDPIELMDGDILRFAKSVKYEAPEGESAIVVKTGTAVIEVPDGVTVELTGGAAGDAEGNKPGVGAGAAIEVGPLASVVLTGEGTLRATGGGPGKAADGGDAAKAEDLKYKDALPKDEKIVMTGSRGGAGGGGGGGAAAAIGGRGGSGGRGGAGGCLGKLTGNAIYYDFDEDSLWGPQGRKSYGNRTIKYTFDGKQGSYSGTGNGQSGSSGDNGQSAGRIYVTGRLTVETVVSNSSAGTDTKAGKKSEWNAQYNIYGNHHCIGYAAGGGGGGSHGAALANGTCAYGVGGGAGGGCGGGGGGGGSMLAWYYSSSAAEHNGHGHAGRRYGQSADKADAANPGEDSAAYFPCFKQSSLSWSEARQKPYTINGGEGTGGSGGEAGGLERGVGGSLDNLVVGELAKLRCDSASYPDGGKRSVVESADVSLREVLRRELHVEVNGTVMTLPFDLGEPLPDLTPEQVAALCTPLDNCCFAGIKLGGTEFYDADGKANRDLIGLAEYCVATAQVVTARNRLLVDGKDARTCSGAGYSYKPDTKVLEIFGGAHVLTTFGNAIDDTVVNLNGADVVLSNCWLTASQSVLNVQGDVTLRLAGTNTFTATVGSGIEVALGGHLTVTNAPSAAADLAKLTVTGAGAAIKGEGAFHLAGGTVDAAVKEKQSKAKAIQVGASTVTGGSLYAGYSHGDCFSPAPTRVGEPLGRAIVPIRDIKPDTVVEVQILDESGVAPYGVTGLSASSCSFAASALYLYLPKGYYQVAVTPKGASTAFKYRVDMTAAVIDNAGGTTAYPLEGIGIFVNGDPLDSDNGNYSWDAGSKKLVLTKEEYTITGEDGMLETNRFLSCLTVASGVTAEVVFGDEDGDAKFSDLAVNPNGDESGTLVIAGGSAWGFSESVPASHVVVKGGSVALHEDSDVTDDQGTRLYRVKVSLATPVTNAVTVSGLPEGYDVSSLYAAAGGTLLYFWLPGGTSYAFTVNGFPYRTLTLTSSTNIVCSGLGLTVNGTDLCQLRGDGWTWQNDERKLTLATGTGSATEWDLAGAADPGANLVCAADAAVRFAGVTRLQSVDAETGRSLKVLGGTLEVVDQIASGTALVICGGSLKLSGGAPVNQDGQPVRLVDVTLAEATGRPVEIEGLGGYETSGIVPLDSHLYLWLPDGYYEFSVDGVGYAVRVRGEGSVAKPATGLRLGGFDVALSGDYEAASAKLTVRAGESVVLSGRGDGMRIVQKPGSTVTLSNVTVESSAPYAVEGPGEATLLLVGENVLSSAGSSSGAPGLAVGASATLKVDDGREIREDGVARLSVTGAGLAAGIGIVGAAGRVVIAGGDIEAKGGIGGAGIGSDSQAQIVPAIEIRGGTVRAVGGDGAAGIGGGYSASGAWVSISGGDVVAVAGPQTKSGAVAADIGWGVSGRSEQTNVVVVITGGTVSFGGAGTVAMGGEEEQQASEVRISGGSVNRGERTFAPAATNDAGEAVFLVKLAVNEQEIRSRSTFDCTLHREGELETYAYGANDLIPKTDGADGPYVLSVFLPTGSYEAMIRGRRYLFEVKGDRKEPVSPLLGVTVDGVDASGDGAGAWSYDAMTSTLRIFGSGTNVLSGANAYGEIRVEQEPSATVVLSNLTLKVAVTNGSSVCASPYRAASGGTARLLLAAGTINSLETTVDAAGLLVPEGAMLEINSFGSGSDGRLKVTTARGRGAGIGGDGDHHVGGISVCGGAVEVSMQGDGAGIGGGSCDIGEKTGRVSVSGGSVSVVRTYGGGAGLGSGANEKLGCAVDISGGQVEVRFGSDPTILGAAIGGGYGVALAGEGMVRISGGTVLAMTRDGQALQDNAEGIGGDLGAGAGADAVSNAVVVTGGTVLMRYGYVNCADKTARDGLGRPLSTVTVQACRGLQDERGTLTIGGLGDYGTTDVRFVEGLGCLGLLLPPSPAGEPYEFSVNGFRYAAEVGGGGIYVTRQIEARLVGTGISVSSSGRPSVDCAEGTDDDQSWQWNPTNRELTFLSADSSTIYVFSGTNRTGDVMLRSSNTQKTTVTFFTNGVTVLEGAVEQPVLAGDGGFRILGGTAVLAGEVDCDCVIKGGSLLAEFGSHAVDSSRNRLYPVDIVVPNLKEGDMTGVRKVTVSGLALDLLEYQTDGIYAVDGKIRLWLPKAESYGLIVDGVHYLVKDMKPSTDQEASFVADQDPKFNCVGVRVSGVDIGNMSGPGWSWNPDGNILSLGNDNQTGPFVLSGTNASCNVSVEVIYETSVTFENLHLVESASATHSPFTVRTGAKSELTLAGDNSLNASAGTEKNALAGIYVEADASILIRSAEGGATGRLDVRGGCNGAGIGGIGGDAGLPFGSVEIAGGEIVAVGGENAAGIGGGGRLQEKAATNGVIEISGGCVAAHGGKGGAGVGAGARGGFVNIEVSGGRLTATGGANAAGIGGGQDVSVQDDADLVLSGGTVIAQKGSEDRDACDIGRGCSDLQIQLTYSRRLLVTGGSIFAETLAPAPSNGAERVWCVTVPGVVGRGPLAVAVDGLAGYGVRDIYPVDGTVRLWLPNGNYTNMAVGSSTYAVKVADGDATAEKTSGDERIDPSEGTLTVRVAAADAEEAVRSVEFQPPAGLSDAAAASYRAAFTVTAAEVSGQPGYWDVTATLGPVTNEGLRMQKSVESLTAHLGAIADAPAATAVSVELESVPGLFYRVWVASEVNGTYDGGPQVRATDDHVNVGVVSPVTKGKGFFRIGVSATGDASR